MMLLFPRLRNHTRFLFFAALALFLVASASSVANAAGGGGGGSLKLFADADEPLVLFMLKALGWLFGPILLAISVAMLALVVLLILDLRMNSAIPAGFVDEFTDTVNKRKFKEAFDMARNDPSFLGQVLTAGMSRLQYGLEDAREAVTQHARQHQERQGTEKQLQLGDRDPGADDRAGRHGFRHDQVILGAGQCGCGDRTRETGRRHLARPGGDTLRRRRLHPRDLLQCVLQEPHYPACAWTSGTLPTIC